MKLKDRWRQINKMNIQFIKRGNNAVVPTRAHPADIGLDLTAVAKEKTYENGVVLYDTQIAVKPPPGFYLEILPRSSMSKTGWMLANSVGTIDPNYTGNLFIALVRVVPDAPEIQLPFCKCQLVLRKAEYPRMIEVNEFEETDRGDGGFGSTDAQREMNEMSRQISNNMERLLAGTPMGFEHGVDSEQLRTVLRLSEQCLRERGINDE